jgi:hypothetical protein
MSIGYFVSYVTMLYPPHTPLFQRGVQKDSGQDQNDIFGEKYLKSLAAKAHENK